MSYRNALSGLFLALLVAWPAAGAFAQAPLTRLYLQESASREVEQNVLVATVQAHAEATSPAQAQAAVNEAMAAAVERVRAEPEIRAATGGYSVYQRRDRDNRPVGWIAEQDLRLTSKDPAALLELAGSLQETGLNLIGLGWQVDRRHPAQGAGRAHHRSDRDAAPARRGDRRERRHAGRQHRHAAGRRCDGGPAADDGDARRGDDGCPAADRAPRPRGRSSPTSRRRSPCRRARLSAPPAAAAPAGPRGRAPHAARPCRCRRGNRALRAGPGGRFGRP